MDDGSIGSMGGQAGEQGVRNVTVERAVLTGTTNGLRIKTWGMPNPGSVTGVSFSQVTMHGVANPILVDQNYCPRSRKVDCPGKVRTLRDATIAQHRSSSQAPYA